MPGKLELSETRVCFSFTCNRVLTVLEGVSSANPEISSLAKRTVPNSAFSFNNQKSMPVPISLITTLIRSGVPREMSFLKEMTFLPPLTFQCRYQSLTTYYPNSSPGGAAIFYKLCKNCRATGAGIGGFDAFYQH